MSLPASAAAVASVIGERFPAPARGITLLTTGNPKTAKGEAHGYLTAILHLAPAAISGVNVCPSRTAGCTAACLNSAGRGGMGRDADGWNAIGAARVRRTHLLLADRRAFMAQLEQEIHAHVRLAERHGLKPAVRLNGTSDLDWQSAQMRDGRNVFFLFPGVTFYDYTKVVSRMFRPRPSNYALTFSASGENDDDVQAVLAAGGNVACVVDVRPKRGRLAADPLPTSFRGRPVVDGDAHDLRFLDPQVGAYVLLRAKGDAWTSKSFREISPAARPFVHSANAN